MQNILARRSIRKYTAQPVKEEDIKDILRAAMAAPSAGNQQPWHFIVVNDRNVLDQIPDYHPHSLMVKEAPLAILICGDEQLEVHKGYWVQDCSAATENLLLAIQAKGLAGVWLGIYPRQDRVDGLRKLFGLPDNVIPFSIIPVGYPAEFLPPEDRYNASRVKYNHW